jgi:hypothetical protein
MQDMLGHGRDVALSTEWQRLIDDARDQADLRHQVITLCHTNDQRTCSGSWADGQLMFIDFQQDGVIHEPSQILVNKQLPLRGGSLHARFYPQYRQVIQFHPLAVESNDNGVVWYCAKQRSRPVWAVLINKLGNTRLMLPDESGSIYDGSGSKLQC